MKQRKHRSSLIIFKEILEVIKRNREATISRIATEANIPHSRLKKQLERMIKAGVIKEINSEGRRYYNLTEKGEKVLRMLKEIESFLSTLGLI